MLVEPTLEVKVIIPPGPALETIPAAEAVITPRATTIDKGKGVYVTSPKRVASNEIQRDREPMPL